MSKKAKYEKEYKSLTLKKYLEIMDSLNTLGKAMANLAIAMQDAGKGVLTIPLKSTEPRFFKFTVMQHKETKEEVLTVFEINEKGMTH